MTRSILVLLCLATACSSGRASERTLPEPEATSASTASPAASASEEPASEEPASEEPAREALPGGSLCARDRCPAVPPPCPTGQTLSVMGEGGCWGPCVPIGECACDADDDCGRIRGATCGPSGRCVVDCDPRHTRSPIEPPQCPDGQVLSVIGAAWGPCVPATTCSCATTDDCPQVRGVSEVCYTAGHCGPAL